MLKVLTVELPRISEEEIEEYQNGLKELLFDKRVSQRELGRALDIGTSAIDRLVNCKQKMSVAYYIAIRYFLDDVGR